MVRNSSITHDHPNCAYLEVESVGAKESLLWKQASCWRESQIEREQERERERCRAYLKAETTQWWTQCFHQLVHRIQTECRESLVSFSQVILGKILIDTYRDDKSLEGWALSARVVQSVLREWSYSSLSLIKYLWECQNFFAFSVWNILKSYSEHITLQPGSFISLSLFSSLREPLSGVSFFLPILSRRFRKAAAWPALPLRVPEEPFHTSFWAQSEVEQQHSSCCLRQGRCYTSRLEFTAFVSSSESSNPLPADHQCHWFGTLFSNATNFHSASVQWCISIFCFFYCI